jgi:hypothetical protein
MSVLNWSGVLSPGAARRAPGSSVAARREKALQHVG